MMPATANLSAASMPDTATNAKPLNVRLLIKWAISLLLPPLFLLLPESTGLDGRMKLFLVITLWAVIVWGFNIISEVAVAMALPVLYVLAGLLPYKAAMSSWTDTLTIITLGGLILGHVVMHTGLTRRIALWGVNCMGGSFVGLLGGMTFAVMIISPLVPSITGKTILFGIIAIGLCDAMGFKARSREATLICLGTFLAVTSTKLCWLTGAGDVILPISIMDKVTGKTTSWLTYALYNAVPGALYTVISVGLALLLLRVGGHSHMRATMQEQYRALPPMGLAEKKAAVILVVTVLLLLTEPLHHMPTAYIIFIMGLINFLPGMGLINGKAFGSMNINIVFFINGCMSIGICANAIGMDAWMTERMLSLLHTDSLWNSSLICYGIGVVINFLLTPVAAFVSLVGPITQMAQAMQVDPAILVHSFQYGLDQFVLPYEYAPFMLAMGMGYIGFKDMALVMLVRMVVMAVFLGCVAVPFWMLVSGWL